MQVVALGYSFSLISINLIENVETCNVEISDNSDEDDWESIASDEIAGEPSKISTADIVLKYFQNKSYRTQQREEHVFANT